MTKCRTGLGWDQHRFTSERALKLGGVLIPNTPGLEGHSDADVILHAVADAMLGAAALGDIGTLFPSEDSRWKDADSRIFITYVREKLREGGFSLVNLDVVVIAQVPHLAPFLPEIRSNLAGLCGISTSDVYVKVKSPEHIGSLGAGEGMSCLALAHVAYHTKKLP